MLYRCPVAKGLLRWIFVDSFIFRIAVSSSSGPLSQSATWMRTSTICPHAVICHMCESPSVDLWDHGTEQLLLGEKQLFLQSAALVASYP